MTTLRGRARTAVRVLAIGATLCFVGLGVSAPANAAAPVKDTTHGNKTEVVAEAPTTDVTTEVTTDATVSMLSATTTTRVAGREKNR